MTETVYTHRDFARFYDWTFHDHGEDLWFYLELAAEHGPSLLELAAGTGRLTIPLARQGFDVTGLDLSPEMLAIAKQKLDKESADVQSRIRLLPADMSDFRLNQRFNMAFVPHNSFFHLHTKEKQAGCLRCMREHLAPGGLAVVDILPPRLMSDQQAGKTIEVRAGLNPATGKMTQELNRKLDIDQARQRVTVEHIYIETEPDGTRRQYTFQETYTWLRQEEMRDLLHQSGLNLLAIHSQYNRQPPDEPARHMIFLATNKKNG